MCILYNIILKQSFKALVNPMKNKGSQNYGRKKNDNANYNMIKYVYNVLI